MGEAVTRFSCLLASLSILLPACAPVDSRVAPAPIGYTATEAPAVPTKVAPRPTVAPITPTFGPTQPHEPTITPVPADPAVLANPDVVQLLDSLRARGISVGGPQESRAAFLYPVQGVAYAFTRGWLHIHPFPNAQAAQARAKQIPAEMTPSIVDWVAPPHFYLCKSAIALYLGTDAQVMRALSDFCGAEFAGPQ